MIILSLKDFMKKYNLRDDTMAESVLQQVYIFPIYPRGSKMYSDKGFVNKDDGSQGGSHWCCFVIKIRNPFTLTALDSILIFFSPYQLPKPIIYPNYKKYKA